MNIPISKVRIYDSARQRIDQALNTGILAQGPQVAELEKLFAERSEVEHAIAVNNGTTALVLALEVLDLQPGDEVITTPFTFAATLNAIIESGATAKFVDIGEDFLMNSDLISEAVTPRTRAILPVHLFGQMVDMTALNNSLDASQGIEIVEDAAQAVGAKFQGRPAGSFGLGCFSLYATKNVGCGEGGMITTSNSLLAEKMRILRNQGMRARYEYVVPGHNYRLTDLHAAIAIPQMEDIDGIITARSQNAAALTDGLKGLEGLVLPSKREGDVHVWNQFTIRLTTDAPVTRDDVITHLSNEGIGTGIYYPNVVFDYDCYRNHPLVSIAEVPIADTYVKNCLSIPVHPSLDKDDINRIISTIQEMWPK